jgi:hypothetical protein
MVSPAEPGLDVLFGAAHYGGNVGMSTGFWERDKEITPENTGFTLVKKSGLDLYCVRSG